MPKDDWKYTDEGKQYYDAVERSVSKLYREKQVPRDFVNDYEDSIHYKIGDKVVDIEAGIHRMGYSYMNLIIEREGVLYQLPFYYNCCPYEPIEEFPENEDFNSEADEIELDTDAWIEGMSGATEWVDWYNDVELEPY
jgi:hypothetical protein